jgi:hypothetical protein
MSLKENYKSVDIGDLEDAETGIAVAASHLEDALEWARKALDCCDVRSVEGSEEQVGYERRAGECRDSALEAIDKVSAILHRLRAFRD